MSDSPSRWDLATAEHGVSGYGECFADLLDSGADIDGEARLADVLVARDAAILDIGSGMGRVSAALAARGHRVTSIEPDPVLREQSLRTYPDLPVIASDALGFDPSAVGAPAAYDLVVCVGNVLVYLAEDSERPVLAKIRDLLAPGGRVLVGFHLVSARLGARDYPAADFVCDVEAAGLRVDSRFGSYELHPPTEEYAVWVLARA